MWITLVIVASFAAAMIAMAYFGIQSYDEAAPRDGGDPRAHGASHRAGECGLCHAPLRRAATTDEVVFELEHRIDVERCEIARAGHAAEPMSHTFRA